MRIAPTMAECVEGAEVVLKLVGATNAGDVVTNLLPLLGTGTVAADLNTSDPAEKPRMAGLIEGAGARFLDVAVLAPVPRAGVGSPLIISGEGTEEFRRALKGTGAGIETADGGPGAAAERKLLRSVFMKGLAAVVIEALEGAKAAGCGGRSRPSWPGTSRSWWSGW